MYGFHFFYYLLIWWDVINFLLFRKKTVDLTAWYFSLHLFVLMVIRVVNTVNSDQNIFLKKPFKDLNIKSVKWSINFLHLQTFLLLLMLYWCFYFLAVLGSDKWRTWDQRNRHLRRRQQHPTGEGQRLLQRGARCVINLSCFIWLDKFQIFIYKFQLFTNLQINNIKIN